MHDDVSENPRPGTGSGGGTPPASPLRLLVVGLTQETNLGDAARHAGLLAILRRAGFSGRIPVVLRIGANQRARFAIDYRQHVGNPDIELVPLPIPTFDNQGTGFLRLAGEAANAVSAAAGVVLLALARLAPRASVAFWPKRYRRSLELALDADFVIWRGVNLRTRSSALLELYRSYAIAFAPLLCFAMGRPVAYVSGSVWEGFAPPARWLLRRVLRACCHVSVRETESARNLRPLLGPGSDVATSLVPDLSFALLADRPARTAPDLRADGIEIAVTLVDWSGFGRAARDRYVDSVARFLEERVQAQRARVTVVPQVVKQWESSARIAEEIRARMSPASRESVGVVEGDLDVEGLIDRYRATDVLLATRMHSAIFALAVGTPVIAVPYDAGAKWQILGDLGAGELVIDYDQVSEEALRSRFELLVERGDALLEEIGEAVREQCARLDEVLPPELRGISRGRG